MASDPDELVELNRVSNEAEAAIIVNALADVGIRALATGGFTSGFKAEAPGDVKIVVRRGDLQGARTALDELRIDPADGD